MLPVFAVAFLMSANATPVGAQLMGAARGGIAECLTAGIKAITKSVSVQNPLPDGDYVIVVCTDPNSGKSAQIEVHPGQQKT